uniref:DUF6729 domain-containing protein n=1 Tax=Clytia hemisphaerica TaxID=252671 RepID=A0A7M5WUE5_9CNID
MQTDEDFALRMPESWRNYLNLADQQWIGRIVFDERQGKRSVLSNPVRLWYNPPARKSKSNNSTVLLKPEAVQYFRRRLCLWVPRRAYNWDFLCPSCRKSLTSKGLYPKIRKVLDISGWYYLATEYMECRSCNVHANSWDRRILDQLPIGIRVKFPALLTLKYSVDQAVVTFLKSRTLGNTPTAFANSLKEVHIEAWMKTNINYM